MDLIEGISIPLIPKPILREMFFCVNLVDNQNGNKNKRNNYMTLANVTSNHICIVKIVPKDHKKI